jgi:GWxTD domain-containing protein
MPGKGIGFSRTIAFLAICGIAGGSNIASLSQGDIRFGIDTALFDYTGTGSLGLEIYQQLDIEQLSMDQDSMARFSTVIVLISGNGDTVAVDQWNSETIWAQNRSVVNSTVLSVMPGEYVLNVVVTDAGNGREGQLSRSVGIESPEHLSEIELAKAVVPAQEESFNPLRKGELIIYPAASGSYTLPEEHTLYYYVEIYNAGGCTLHMQSQLQTYAGEIIFARPWVPLAVPDGADAISLVDSLDLRVIRNSGLHRMVLEIVIQGDTLEVEKFLMVRREAELISESGGESPEEVTVLPYPEHFRLILSARERDIYDNLEEDAAVRFYSAYWLGRTEQRQQFEIRCSESERYSGAFKDGWETDRGRVYVIYGAPDDIEAFLFQGDRIPHEIWYYHESMNERFIFADRWGLGEYEQIFSTLEGEISYSNWEEMMLPVSSRTGGGGD